MVYFHAELRQLETQCKFANPGEEIKSQLISGCLSKFSKKVRDEGFTTPLDLTNLMQDAKTLDMTEVYAKLLAPDNIQINNTHLQSNPRYSLRQTPQSRCTSQRCRNCGGKKPHVRGQSKCSALNKTCHNCSKLHHFHQFANRQRVQSQKPIS
ncbi:hypothetical protein RRG08_026517 [Elysia crispata]|uniref:Uncharacterized protein n=1 Tax=Elysia crispata TaxID=231223 RepID=A0AAE1CS32_9GAST|nr:hypothetical protein RRG08_026517 [Elysia crispata]